MGRSDCRRESGSQNGVTKSVIPRIDTQKAE